MQGTTLTVSWGYKFLPLLGTGAYAGVKINFSLVFMEIFAVTVICGLAYVLLESKQK